MLTIPCSWEEFKRMAREFHEAAPTLDIDGLQNAWKCLCVAYIGMTDEQWTVSARILLDLEAKWYMKHELALLAPAVA